MASEFNVRAVSRGDRAVPRVDAPVATTATRTDDVPFRIVGAFAASCFVGALVADLVYAQWPDFKWVTFSVWLITIGLVVAALATIVGLIDRVVRGRLGALSRIWPYPVGFAAVVVVEIFNVFVHSRDAYEAVVPEGLALSVAAVALLVLVPIVGRAHLRTRARKAPL